MMGRSDDTGLVGKLKSVRTSSVLQKATVMGGLDCGVGVEVGLWW